MQPSVPRPDNATPPPPVTPVVPPSVAANGGLPPVPPSPAATLPPQGMAGPAAPAPSAANATTSSNAPAMANDGDLIEKEWVQKVQQITAAAANDPYQLSQQLTALKADYLQKRYNKSLKTEGH